MYKLYTRAGSGGFAAEAALSMAGVPFTKVEVKRGPPDEAFLGISPLGQVPVLTLPDGSSVTESAAICILIAELYPEAVLSPAPGSPGRAHFLRWMLFMSSVLYPALLRFFYAERYSASADGVAEVKRYALAESDRAFVILDAALEDRDWLVGDRHSIADVYLLMLGCWHPVDDRPREEWTNLTRHASALKEVPALASLNASHRMW
jgi:glutathione S-transferase